MQPNSIDQDTLGIVVHLLWECRNVLADYSQIENSNNIEKIIILLLNSQSIHNITV